jgi:ribosome recycling factor
MRTTSAYLLAAIAVFEVVDGVSGFMPLRALPSLRSGNGVQVCRSISPVMMAKGKKGGGKKGGGGGGDASADAGGDDADFVKVKVDTDVKGTDPKSIIASVVEKFEKTVESTKASLASIRTGRPSPNLLDRVLVDYYGTNTPIPNVATVNVVSATTITVEPFEADLLKEIEKAISMSDLGMTPNNDGKMIRLNVPPLNAETRQKYVKQAKASGEDGKVAARNVRRTGVDAIKKLEKDKKIGEDESKGLQDDIQKKTDKAVKDIDVLTAAKEKELTTV